MERGSWIRNIYNRCSAGPKKEKKLGPKKHLVLQFPSSKEHGGWFCMWWCTGFGLLAWKVLSIYGRQLGWHQPTSILSHGGAAKDHKWPYGMHHFLLGVNSTGNASVPEKTWHKFLWVIANH